jgi:hypothetical protein
LPLLYDALAAVIVGALILHRLTGDARVPVGDAAV